MFQYDYLEISDALSIGQQGFKENLREEDNLLENRVGGIGGGTTGARVLVRGSSGKDNCLLRVDFCLQIFFVSSGASKLKRKPR